MLTRYFKFFASYISYFTNILGENKLNLETRYIGILRVCRNLNFCIFLVYFQQIANRRWSHSGLRRPIPLIGKRAPLPDPPMVGKTTLNQPMVVKRSSSDNELFMRTMRAYEPGTKSNAQFSNKARTRNLPLAMRVYYH